MASAERKRYQRPRGCPALELLQEHVSLASGPGGRAVGVHKLPACECVCMHRGCSCMCACVCVGVYIQGRGRFKGNLREGNAFSQGREQWWWSLRWQVFSAGRAQAASDVMMEPGVLRSRPGLSRAERGRIRLVYLTGSYTQQMAPKTSWNLAMSRQGWGWRSFCHRGDPSTSPT